MQDIISETRVFIEAALAGDPSLSSLKVTGNATSLAATIVPGRPPNRVGRGEYRPEPPFLRETMVELIVRMQRSRWSRFDELTLTMRSATNDDLDKIELYDPMCFDAHSISCECGPGWYDMLEAVFSWVRESRPEAWWKVSQLKEKFGGLRLYHNGAPAFVDEVIDAAEHLSEFVCEECGAPGKKSSSGGWVSTRCDQHQEDDE